MSWHKGQGNRQQQLNLTKDRTSTRQHHPNHHEYQQRPNYFRRRPGEITTKVLPTTDHRDSTTTPEGDPPRDVHNESAAPNPEKELQVLCTELLDASFLPNSLSPTQSHPKRPKSTSQMYDTKEVLIQRRDSLP